MNRSSVCWLLLMLLAVLSVPAREVRAQDSLRVLIDTSRVQVIRLSDGSVVVGRVVEVRGDTAVIRTQTGHATVARSAVRSVRERAASSMRGGEYWPEDPNATRLFFAATGRMLAEGEGYFCDIWVFLLCLTGGLTDRITIGGGMSVFPFIDLAENVFYVTPKVGVVATDGVQVAVGAFAGWAGAVTEQASSFGMLYGVSTFGSEDANVSAGVGYAYYNDDIADSPLLMGGFKLRMSRGSAFISENYVLPGSEGGVISLGVRFFGERMSGDVALVRIMVDNDGVTVPFVGLAVKFR